MSASRKAWLVGGGIGSLATAAFMIRDGGLHVVTDGLLVTGQNPTSLGPAAQALLQAMRVAAH